MYNGGAVVRVIAQAIELTLYSSATAIRPSMHAGAQQPFVGRQPKGNHIRPESARAVLHAERYARAQRRFLNLMVTVDLQKQPVSGKTPYEIFRKHFWGNARARWNTLVKNGKAKGPFDSIAVFENPMIKSQRFTRSWGPYHVHWFIRWPTEHQEKFAFHLRSQFRKSFGSFSPSNIHLLKVDSPAGVAAYLVKGIDPTYAKHFHIWHTPQGKIDHRRIITSIPLGRASQKRYRSSGRDPLPRRSKAANKRILEQISKKLCDQPNHQKGRPTEVWHP